MTIQRSLMLLVQQSRKTRKLKKSKRNKSKKPKNRLLPSRRKLRLRLL